MNIMHIIKVRLRGSMKKFLVVISVIVVLFLILITWIKFFQKEPNPYLEKGYTEQEVARIDDLSEEIKAYLLEVDYQENLLDYLDVDDMQEEHLKDYIVFEKLYGLGLEETVYIVNHGYNTASSYDENTVAFMHGTYYIHDYLERYLAYQENMTISFDTLEQMRDYVITAVNSNLDYAFYSLDENVDLDKKYLLLVNKYYKLESNYAPDNMVTIKSNYGVAQLLESTVYEQYKLMWNAAKEAGLTLYIRSPYRSYTTQLNLYNRYVASDGKTAADTYSARAGYSEHQTGLAFDVTSPSTNFDTFEYSREFSWLQENAHKYGFILRYPKGKEYITGYIYEPWHYRYVGVDAATTIHETGLTYEEYYAYYVR